MVRLLGTQDEDKRFVQYDTGHSVPWNEYVHESTDWLDRHLGPVRR